MGVVHGMPCQAALQAPTPRDLHNPAHQRSPIHVLCCMQFNSTVLTGSLAALTKSMVEYFQLGIARGDVLLTRVWFALESTNTLLAALPLVLKQKWAEAKAFIRAYEAF